MNNELFSNINGTSIIVSDFTIEHHKNSLAVKISCITEDQKKHFIVFNNASNIKLSEISYPFQICGFEILDYSSRGYQKELRYLINDYEDGKFSFWCEDFEILDANN